MKKKIYQKISEKIQDRVEKKIYKSGDRLPSERSLAVEFGVSRNTIREAVKVLCEKNIIVSMTGSGNFVSEDAGHVIGQCIAKSYLDSLKKIKELFELRKIIEPGIASLAAQRISEKEIVCLDKVLKAQKENLNSIKSIELDEKFHGLIVKASKNPVLINLYRETAHLLSKTRADEYQGCERTHKSISNHEALLNALKCKNSKKAFNLMEQHMNDIEQILIG